jgi:hypothetical protein
LAVYGADERTTFQAKPAGGYAHKQTSEKVTIAAEQFITDDQAKDAFGKVNPWRLGVLPVLVVIQNDSAAALRIDRIRFIYVLPDRTRVEATPAGDLRFLQNIKTPTTGETSGGEEREESAGRVGDRGSVFFGEDDSAGAVGKRFRLFPGAGYKRGFFALCLGFDECRFGKRTVLFRDSAVDFFG